MSLILGGIGREVITQLSLIEQGGFYENETGCFGHGFRHAFLVDIRGRGEGSWRQSGTTGRGQKVQVLLQLERHRQRMDDQLSEYAGRHDQKT
jgi:hypothetical protein